MTFKTSVGKHVAMSPYEVFNDHGLIHSLIIVPLFTIG